jgi:anti-anti-sigma factor
MQITTTIGPVTVLEVTGDIDSETFSHLIEEAGQRIEAGQVRLVLDLSGVNYISSGGLVALQTILGRAVARGGNMVLCGITPRVRKVLEITGFDQRLSIFPDRAAAMASMG